MVIPASLVAGALAGNKVKYKTLIIIGIILYLIGGFAPAFANNFSTILIERAIFGIGWGLIAPLGNALAISFYEGNKRASILGLGAVIMNLGSIVMQFAGGALAVIGWKYSFYSHALGIVSLIFVIIFLTEPPKVAEPAGAEKSKIRVRGVVVLTAFLVGIYCSHISYSCSHVWIFGNYWIRRIRCCWYCVVALYCRRYAWWRGIWCFI